MTAPLRIRLLTPDLALLDAAVAGDVALSRALGHDVAEGWAVFETSLSGTRDALAADPASARWGTRLFISEDEPRTLVGWGGFKGPPQDGAVEIGYAVAPAWRGRGAASAAVRKMLGEAWADPSVQAVIAHTLAERNASVRVLERAGFERTGERVDDGTAVWAWRLERREQ
ncbi:MAG TPA: GNAT family N-acetyltransferase [Solirubrobacteraceae bacterium]|nr:GNAT family N-acetyltransferase [Solirubrobacteraceae bacterium]